MHKTLVLQAKTALWHLAALGFAGLHSLSPAKPAAAEKAVCLNLPQAAAYRFFTSSVAYGDSFPSRGSL